MHTVMEGKAVLVAKLQEQLVRFARMRDHEEKNGHGMRNQDWKIRRQYLQGRIESLEYAIKLVNGESKT